MYTISFRAMGCQINVWLDSKASRILQDVPMWIEEMEAALSRFRADSQLSRLNDHLNEWISVSAMLWANLLAAKQGARLTDGLYNPLILNALVAAGYDRTFDQIQAGQAAPAQPAADWHGIQLDMHQHRVWLPAPIDLGGVAKGWAAQNVAERLAHFGAVLVDIGGDMAVRGAPSGEAGWKIRVDEPGAAPTSAPVATVVLQSGSIVTSGIDFRRWGKDQHHLIDPRTGYPAESDVISATIIHPHAAIAEAYAKAVLLMGSQRGLEWINKQWEGAALVVCKDGAVLATDRFQSYAVGELV